MSWPRVKIGDCCEVVSGATPKTGNPEYWGGDIPWVSPKTLSKLESKYLDEPTDYITQAGFDSCSTRMLPAMSLLLSCRAPVGLTAINREPICTNQGFKSLIPNSEIVDVNYLFHVMRRMRPMLEAQGRGATFTEVSKAIVERFEIPLPPLNQQRVIAEILDNANRLERATLRVQQLRSDLITGTFLDFFGDPVANPNNFDKVKLGSVTKFHKQGLYFNQGYSKSGNQLIRIADMRKDGSLNFGTMPFIEIDSKTQKQFSVEVGDFLFARSGSIGTCAIVREETNAVFGSFIIKFQFTEELLNDYFIHYYQLPQIEMMMRSMSHGSTNTNINAKNIKNLDVIVPPISLQEKFVQIVNSIKQMPDSTELSSTNSASIAQELCS